MVEESGRERERGALRTLACHGLAAYDMSGLAALRGPAHDVDNVRELDSLVYVVGHHQRRGAAGIDHVEKPLVHVCLGKRIERGKGLVQEHELAREQVAAE